MKTAISLYVIVSFPRFIVYIQSLIHKWISIDTNAIFFVVVAAVVVVFCFTLDKFISARLPICNIYIFGYSFIYAFQISNEMTLDVQCVCVWICETPTKFENSISLLHLHVALSATSTASLPIISFIDDFCLTLLLLINSFCFRLNTLHANFVSNLFFHFTFFSFFLFFCIDIHTCGNIDWNSSVCHSTRH